MSETEYLTATMVESLCVEIDRLRALIAEAVRDPAWSNMDLKRAMRDNLEQK